MRLGRILAALTGVMLLWGAAAADTYNAADRTTAFQIKSGRLDETREIFVRTPPNYDPENETYPVVYVLDGEWNFEFVAAYLDFGFDNEIYPEMIVTGVRNVNRNRDYVPRADQYFSDTGEADRFLEFVKEEWIDEISDRYPVSNDRVLIGHSFGGVFTLHALFREPDLFDAHIALGSSAWIADRILFDEASEFFAANPENTSFVYMAVGEGDGGPTVPSSVDLAARFEEEAPETLEWTFEITPKTDHFKNVPSGMHNAFMLYFPAWEFDDEVVARAESGGAAGVDAWFAEKHEALGFRFNPAWFDMGIAALGLSRGENSDAALALMAQMRAHYPENAHVASFSASVFENTGDHQSAEAEYRRAADIAREKGLHPNAIHLDGLERGIARNRDAQSGQ